MRKTKLFRKMKITTFFFLVILTFSALPSLAQSNEVSGTVKDNESGEALPGVTVLLDGTATGTITDANGNYRLQVKGENPVLQYSFVGYETKFVEVGGKSVINVGLDISIDQLEEVVVIGYGSIKKRDQTGAVASIKGASFEDAEPLSIQNALAGRVAGVQITQTDNAPGAGVRVLIRGGSSLTGGNEPLYVIDGFPIIPDESDPATNPLADISPNQIESVEVLKDASATAIYGAQGANGVIIITTKLGKEGKPSITANANFGVSEMTRYPNILSPEEFAHLRVNNIKSYQFANMEEEGGALQYWQNIIENEEWGKNWIEEITRLAQTKTFNVGFSGGDKNFKYAVSANYLDQEGVIDNSGFERLNLNTNLEQKIGDKIRIGTSLKISTTQNEGLVNTWEETAIIKTALQSNPYIADDFSVQLVDENDESFAWNNENIIDYVNNVDNQFETSRMIGNLFFEYEFLEGLKFYTSYGFNNYVKDGHNFLPKSTRLGDQIGGRVDTRKIERERYVYQSRLNYAKSIGKHQIGATAAFETTQNRSTNFFTRVEGFEDDSRGAYDYSSASTPFLPTNFYEDNSLMSYLGRINYTFAGKYLFTASLRSDGSSKFGKNNKWGYFPSVAVGWVASDENFIKNLNAFDLLKVRASYGVTGNNQIPSYSSLATLSTQRYIFNDVLYSGAVPGSIANPDLKWETTDQYNIGVDLGFFKSRVMINADYYYKLTTDLLLEVQLPVSSGFNKAIKNVGSISNQGWELGINTVNVDRGKFKWTSAFTLSSNRSEVLDLGESSEMFFTRNFYHKVRNEVLVREGEQIGIYYGYIEDEILNSETEIANSPEMKVLENTVGQVKLYDVNGDGVVDPSDQVPLAKTVPDFIGGLNNQVNYGNFDLNFFFRWSYGNDIINGNITFLDRAGVDFWNTLHGYADYRYTPQDPGGTVHGLVQDTYSTHMRSAYVEDGSFLKLDYVTLGYRIPQAQLNKLSIQSLRIFGRITNPVMFTRYSWFDPEVSTGWGTVAKVGPGADVGTYPRATTYTVGLSIGL